MSETHILVVDDEPGITRLCLRILKKAEYKVTAFNDPTTAIKYVEKNKIDLLLVDIRMPEISGFDIITQIKHTQPDTAVLVMTGYGSIETAIQALRQGVDGLILKPFNTGDDLVKTVQQALDDNQKRRDSARIRALRPLFNITESFLAETHPDHLAKLIVKTISDHLRCNNAGFYKYSIETKSLKIMSSRGIILPWGLDSNGKDMIGRSFVKEIPEWVNSGGPGESVSQSAIRNIGLCSIFTAPITRIKVKGVLYAGRNGTDNYFREVEWEMFLLIARQAAVAMENAYLYEELRSYVQRIEESQQALIRAEKIAAAGRLTASIAHEINNPLQSVQNCLHLATRGELPVKKQREYLDLANHELDRLMSTVQKMLDFYRPGGGTPQRIDIVILMRRVIKLLMPQLCSRKIYVRTHFSSKLPSVLAVSNQLEQVFINLILNAYDAMPDGGELRINAKHIQGMIEIFIHDTGPGISEENRKRIFEPFVSTKEGGTGLGLSVSFGIISALGGNLDLMTEIRPGACFRITLPVKENRDNKA